jgi:hypothetical protein
VKIKQLNSLQGNQEAAISSYNNNNMNNRITYALYFSNEDRKVQRESAWYNFG